MNLRLNNVCYKYKNDTLDILKNINFELKGSKLGLIGHSGSGKSTLVHLLNGMRKPTTGSIEINGVEINSNTKLKSILNLRKDVAIVYQFTDLQLFSETVEDELLFAVNNFNIDTTKINDEIKKYFRIFNLSLDLLKVSPFSLSGGQKKKVAIITMLLIKPKLMILDEPTIGLDPKSIKEILNAIDILVNDGLKVIIISHDINVIYSFCDYILQLDKGKVIFDGTKNVFLKEMYKKKKTYMLPTKLRYASIIDKDDFLFEKVANGEDLSLYIKPKDTQTMNGE